MAAARPRLERGVIRALRRSDIAELVRLTDEVAAEGRWIAREAPIDREATRSDLEGALDAEYAATFVATVDDRPVGYLTMRLAAGGVADFGMLLREDVRGRGLGRALLEEALAWARGVGAHKVALQLWPGNEAAHRLYRRAGFVEEGRLRRHYRRRDGSLWDALIMGLDLNPEAPSGPPWDRPGPPAGRPEGATP